eukprot:TRINITY_DN5297_c0_g1_i1.p1 TRINITY_DN5297_c0_g1~~TRINITY_DN5297_c0_g1_i1.p1  ORF type:complete len:345 (+),score=70.29 TRINITY_DN5297_c0_g1_i1:304-1338(+)
MKVAKLFPVECHCPASLSRSHYRIFPKVVRKRIGCNLLSSRMAPQRLGSVEKGNVVVGNKVELQNKKSVIKAGGPSKLQVIADFDMTLTKYMIDGKRGQSSHSLLKQGSAEYDKKRQELFDYYHPLEICPTIPLNEKIKLMEEWWEKTHALLVEGGLTYAAIRDSVKDAVIEFRDGVIELFEILERKGVPVLIFSAGLADIIEEVMRQKLKKKFKNIEVVSNRMVFDDHGSLKGFRGKTIHVLNKNEHALEMAGPIHEEMGSEDVPCESGASLVKNRVNVLLLGDHIGDLAMSDGFNYENRISIAFLNDNIEEWMETYKKSFDIVLADDPSMKEVVLLVEELLE